MERSHTPLSTWFWAASLIASQTPGMVRPDQDRIDARAGEHVEVDETCVGGRTRGEGRGVHHKTLVTAAVEVRHREPGTAQDKSKAPLYARVADRHRRLERLWQLADTQL